MPDAFLDLMSILSRPRPNGSQAEQDTLRKLCSWLDARAIPFRTQAFKRYPYFFECIGIWLIASRLALVITLWLNSGWVAFILALIGIAGGVGDMLFNFPLVTWPGIDTGKNLLIEFRPPLPRQEIILCAHYDTKTEPLDHHKRMVLLRLIPTGICLTLVLGITGIAARIFLAQGLPIGSVIYWINIILSLSLLLLSLALGLNVTLGRLLPPSQGAVDNGAACAILLELANRLGSIAGLPESINNLLQDTQVTIALFTGEEANMQGSKAFLRDQGRNLPACAVNLEVMAQDGDYVLWQQDGTVFHQMPASESLIQLLIIAIRQVTGKQPITSGPLTSDGGTFLSKNIPAATLGTADQTRGLGGFHSIQDNIERVVQNRLVEGVEILLQLLTGLQNAGYIKNLSEN